jgi:hypothetical protein
MAYALMGIESLAVALLLLALVLAWTAQAGRRLLQAGPPVLLALLLVGGAGLVTVGLVFLYEAGSMDGERAVWALAFTVALLVGTTLVLYAGLRLSGAGLGVLLLLLGGTAVACGLSFFLATGNLKGPWGGAALALTLTVTLGAAVALFWGLHLGDPAAVPAAQAWSRSRLALGLAAMVVVDCITFSNVDLSIKVEMASVRAEAGARASLLAPPRVSEGDNAAPTYRQAFEALTSLDRLPVEHLNLWSPSGWDPRTGPKFDPRGADLKKFLDSQRRGLELLRKAAARPGCWFGHDYQDGFNLRLPEVQSLREGAFVLALDALAKAAAGDGSGAARDIALVFRIARHINEPTLITFLVARAVEQIATRALEEVLSRSTPPAEDLALVAREGHTTVRDDLVRAMRMEESAGCALFATLSEPTATRWLEQDLGDPAGLRIIQSSFYRVFFLKGDLAAYRRAMRGFQELVERPYFRVRQDLDAFEMAFRRRQGGILTKLLMPAVVKCSRASANADALRELRELALAATAYRIKHGSFPQRLDDLVPDHLAHASLDPFDGQPMRMKRDGKDLVLYSIGPNLRDDGGTASNNVNEGDIVFRLRGR